MKTFFAYLITLLLTVPAFAGERCPPPPTTEPPPVSSPAPVKLKKGGGSDNDTEWWVLGAAVLFGAIVYSWDGKKTGAESNWSMEFKPQAEGGL